MKTAASLAELICRPELSYDTIVEIDKDRQPLSHEVIEQVEAFADECLEKYGSRLFFCADEFYIKAGIDLHDDEYYEEYAQIENGVGMLTSLLTEFGVEAEYINEYLEKYNGPRKITVVTGMAAYTHIKQMCDELCRLIDGLEDNDDVQEVYHNVDLPEEEEEE